MFKLPELTKEQKDRIDEKESTEQIVEWRREEIHRRRECIGYAVQLEETRAENLLLLADKIYDYIYGARE